MRTVGKVLLAHDRKIVCGKIADYRLIKLLERKEEYIIGIFYNKDKAMHRISGKISHVIRLYDLVVKNAVTPCTLYDVMEDLTYPKG